MEELNGDFVDVNGGGTLEDAALYPLDAPVVAMEPGFFSQITGMAKHGDDSALFVKFYKKKIVNRHQSKMLGKEVATEEEYVLLRGPGRLGTEVHHKVRPDLIGRFHLQYNRWKAGKDQLVGTPIAKWDLVSEEQKHLLIGLQIRTIEQLAGASASTKQDLGPNLAYLVPIAIDVVSKSRKVAPSPQAAAEFNELKEQNKKLMEANMNLLGRVEALEVSTEVVKEPGEPEKVMTAKEKKAAAKKAANNGDK